MRQLMFCLALVMMFVTGCASSDRLSVATTQAGHAQCLVCKKDADLACVDVAVDAQTPTYLYNDKTYYFCSTECRDKFARDPRKYVPKEDR